MNKKQTQIRNNEEKDCANSDENEKFVFETEEIREKREQDVCCYGKKSERIISRLKTLFESGWMISALLLSLYTAFHWLRRKRFQQTISPGNFRLYFQLSFGLRVWFDYVTMTKVRFLFHSSREALLSSKQLLNGKRIFRIFSLTFTYLILFASNVFLSSPLTDKERFSFLSFVSINIHIEYV